MACRSSTRLFMEPVMPRRVTPRGSHITETSFSMPVETQREKASSTRRHASLTFHETSAAIGNKPPIETGLFQSPRRPG